MLLSVGFCWWWSDFAPRAAHAGENSSVPVNMSSSDFNFSLQFYFQPFPKGKKALHAFSAPRPSIPKGFPKQERRMFREQAV